MLVLSGMQFTLAPCTIGGGGYRWGPAHALYITSISIYLASGVSWYLACKLGLSVGLSVCLSISMCVRGARGGSFVCGVYATVGGTDGRKGGREGLSYCSAQCRRFISLWYARDEGWLLDMIISMLGAGEEYEGQEGREGFQQHQ